MLKQAQTVIEEDPAEAFRLLSSIEDPEKMDKKYYMQYIVNDMQAKRHLGKNVSKDTLIYKAQKYFDKKDDIRYSALSNYYAATVYYLNNIHEKELEHYMLAHHYAVNINDSLLAAKSLHSIAQTYYRKRLRDSANVYYKRALDFYPDNEKNRTLRLQALRFLSVTHNLLENHQEAYIYANKGLAIAEEFDNISYQATFSHILGMINTNTGKYDKAAIWMHKALKKTQSDEEAGRIYLTLLRTYNDANKLDSAQYCSEKLKEHLADFTFAYSTQESYQELSIFYEKKGDYKSALEYGKLFNESTEKINSDNLKDNLDEAARKYKDVLHQKELDSLRLHTYIYIACGVGAFLIIAIIIFFVFRNMRRENQRTQEKNKLLAAKMEAQDKLLKQHEESLVYMQSIYRNIITEWSAIDKTVKAMARELGVKEEPQLYSRMKNMVRDFTHNTNEQLIRLGKEHFSKEPYGENALSILKDKELLLFMLYNIGYKRSEVAVIMGVNPHKDNMAFRKLDLKNKLIKAGMPQNDVVEILFTEDN
ncbi:lipopolysaccharide assembly protein LapB [Prevotella sp. 10(H)]|uniref:tetratricopeptide repeat protein n=1 Tax=Prevotella sp. 10(H) TaxID=1158294 RepID=UPI0004A6BE6F|nr:hypothetical protein [Prevotella sp. 10(H)]